MNHADCYLGFAHWNKEGQRENANKTLLAATKMLR